MRLCTHDNLPDRLDHLNQVLAFMQAALCGDREDPFSSEDLCGAQFVFEALRESLEEMRVCCIAKFR